MLLATYLFAMMLLVVLLAALVLHLTGGGFAPR
jgi:hypothetical protein